MSGRHVLIVDDNPVNLRLTRIVLEKSGFTVSESTSGEEGLIAIEELRPDLVLMDIQLPGMDGLEVTRRLRQNPKCADVIVVALTAYAMKGDLDRAMAAGCNGYISKPIDTRTLPEQVSGYFKRHRAALRRVGVAAQGSLQEQTVVDVDRLREQCGNDSTLLNEILQLFLDRRATLLDDIRSALSNDDAVAMERATHSLRGYFASFCAVRASRIAQSLEERARTRDLRNAGSLFSRLEAETDALASALQSILEQSRVPSSD